MTTALSVRLLMLAVILNGCVQIAVSVYRIILKTRQPGESLVEVLSLWLKAVVWTLRGHLRTMLGEISGFNRHEGPGKN